MYVYTRICALATYRGHPITRTYIPSIERTLLKPGVSSHDVCIHLLSLWNGSQSIHETPSIKKNAVNSFIVETRDYTFIYTIYLYNTN